MKDGDLSENLLLVLSPCFSWGILYQPTYFNYLLVWWIDLACKPIRVHQHIFYSKGCDNDNTLFFCFFRYLPRPMPRPQTVSSPIRKLQWMPLLLCGLRHASNEEFISSSKFFTNQWNFLFVAKVYLVWSVLFVLFYLDPSLLCIIWTHFLFSILSRWSCAFATKETIGY